MVAAGLDALAHAVEGYVSRFDNPVADAQAEKSVEMILRVLPRTVAEPDDLASRLEMMIAAMFAGAVQNLKVPGIGHAVAHQLGSKGIPHGLACGALLDRAVSLNCQQEKVTAKYRRIAEMLGLQGPEDLVEQVITLKEKLEVPSKLSEMAGGKALTEEDVTTIAEGALQDICARANPVGVTKEIIEDLLEAAW